MIVLQMQNIQKIYDSVLHGSTVKKIHGILLMSLKMIHGLESLAYHTRKHKERVYHEYTRQHRPRKSWDDLSDWSKWDRASLARNRRLLNIDGEHDPSEDFGEFGFGPHRTLEDYEKFAGIKFEIRGVQQSTLSHREPPNSPEEPYNRIFKHCIDIGFDKVPHDDYTFWAVAFEDKGGTEIYRKDADADEIRRMKNDPDKYCKLWRIFHASDKPKRWVVWPYSNEHGWCDRLTGEL
jgi:hypothetical protein